MSRGSGSQRENRGVRIAIVTDAWSPQMNGVVRTLQATRAALEAAGHAGRGDLARPLPVGAVPDLSRNPAGDGAQCRCRAADRGARVPMRCICRPRGRCAWPRVAGACATACSFTTAYHTQFPDYVAARTGVSPEWIWKYIRWFHSASRRVLVSTRVDPPRAQRARRCRIPGTGAAGSTSTCFSPDAPPPAAVCRLAAPDPALCRAGGDRKEYRGFSPASGHPGSKVVVGDGPARGDARGAVPSTCISWER